MPIVRIACVCICCFLSAFCAAAKAVDLLPSVWVTADSCGMVNGVSYTDGNPQLRVNGQLQLTKQLTLGGQFHASSPDGIRQRHRGFSFYAAYDKAINERWLLGGAFTRRQFIGGAQDWDYHHITAYAKHVSGAGVDIMHSPNYYGTGLDAKQATVSLQKDIYQPLYYRIAASQFDLDTSLDYTHAQFVLGTNINKLNVELGYYWVSDTFTPTPIGLITPPKWQFRVLYFLY